MRGTSIVARARVSQEMLEMSRDGTSRVESGRVRVRRFSIITDRAGSP